MGTTNPGFDTQDMEELPLRQEIAFLKEEIASIQAPAKVKTLYKKLFQKRRKIKDLERENSELWAKVNQREGGRDLIKETEVIESDTSTRSSNEDSDKNSQPDENVNSEDVLEENSVVGDLVLKLDDARRGNNSLREEINVKYNELQKLADEIQTYKEQYERLQNDINGRKAEQGKTIQENDVEEQKETSDQGFDEEFAHKTSKNDNELTDKPVNSSATKVWSRSQMKLEKLQAKYGELENALRSKVRERNPLRSELSACKDALKSTKFELSTSKAHVNDLEGELAALQRQFDDMKDKCQKETARNDQIKDELYWYKLQKEQQSRIQKSQEKSDEIISDLEAKLKESHSVLDEMKARLLDMQLQKMNEKLNENGTKAEVSNDQAEKEDQSDFQIRHWTDTDIKSTVYTPEKSGFEEKKIDEDSDEEFANICTLEEENKKLQASIESYQQNIHLLHQDYKTKMSALENNLNRKHSLEKHTLECSLNGKEHMLRKLKKERDEFEECFVKEADDRVRKIEEQKKRCLEEIEYLKDTLENRNEEVERLERKLHEKESALENTKTAQEEAEDALSDSKREANKYKHEVDMLQEDMNNLTRKYTQAMQFLENIELKRIAVENSYKSQVKDATPAKGNQTVSFSKNIDVINVNRYSYYSSVSFTEEEEEVEERSAELSEIIDNPVPFHEQPAIAEEPKTPVVEESIVDDSVSEQYQASDDVANLPPSNSKTENQTPRKKVKLRRSDATTESDRPFVSRSSLPKSTSSIDETMSPTVVDSYQSSLQWVSEEIKQLETNGTDNKSRIDMLKEKEKQILKLIEEVQQGDKTDLESWLEKVKFFENECKKPDFNFTTTPKEYV